MDNHKPRSAKYVVTDTTTARRRRKIDFVSRFFFPLAYIAFNVVYWIYYCLLWTNSLLANLRWYLTYLPDRNVRNPCIEKQSRRPWAHPPLEGFRRVQLLSSQTWIERIIFGCSRFKPKHKIHARIALQTLHQSVMQGFAPVCVSCVIL